jgi:succinoglycan biosynthesis protein ExoL
MTLKIAYLVHDLSDAAVRRRVRMFQLAGATVALAGFRRGDRPVAEVEGAIAADLGQTADARLFRRAISVAGTMAHLGRLESTFRGASAVVARNLEMLAPAVMARARFAPDAPLTYECLDIHRLLLSPSIQGRLLRTLEDRLWTKVDHLITSSPAFICKYFGPRNFPAAVHIVENKVVIPSGEACKSRRKRTAAAPPWRIGWFGIIRCRESLAILSELARSMDGGVEIVIRGKASTAVFPDFSAEIASLPHVSYEGPYQNPEDLADIYGNVHFAWTDDYYEADQNSDWLLPNRLYEGALFGAIPLARKQVETGRWLARHRAGVLLSDPPLPDLKQFFSRLTIQEYMRLAEDVSRIPWGALADDAGSCRAMTAAIAGRAGWTAFPFKSFQEKIAK